MTEFIGTGPFRLNERLPDRYISLVRFEDYASRDEDPDGYGGGKTAYFDEIRFIPVPEQSVRADGLITDEFDYSESLSTDNYQALNAEPDLELQVTLPYYFYGAHFNKSSESMMANEEIRRALLTAVDMAPVAAAGFGPSEFWRLGPEINAPETAWYTDAGQEHYDIGDTELARQMLEDAGYDGTAIRWISTREYSYNYNMALVMRDQMEAAGANIDLQVLDWATLVATRSQRDQWDIFITGHPSYNHPILQVFLNETWPGFWANERKDELIDLIIEEPDHDVQMGYIEELQQIWWDDAAMVKVCEGATLRGYRTRMKGYTDPVDWFFWNAWFEE
jgi:peptide/nickel transport system substrate-binding protein